MSDFVLCEKCGRKLIKRTRDGGLHFRYGGPRGFASKRSRVDMLIVGNGCVNMKCGKCGENNFILVSLEAGFNERRIKK